MFVDGHSNLEDLIIRYILGELAEGEREEVSSFIERDANAGRIYKEYYQIYSNSKNENLANRFNANAAIESFKKHTQAKKKGKERNIKRFLAIGIAASILIALGIFIITMPPSPVGTPIVALSEKIQGQRISDGTIISLNRQSSLSYNVSASDKRFVTIDSGEVFFNVAKDSLRPFVINANSITITVAGTSFNVNAKNADSTIVSVMEGLVSVESKQGTKQLLCAHQEATFYTNGKQPALQSQSNLNSIYWKTETLTFENSHFQEFIPQIEKAYSTRIYYNKEATKECLLSAKFKDQPIEAVLEILSATFGAELTKNTDGSYTFSQENLCQ